MKPILLLSGTHPQLTGTYKKPPSLESNPKPSCYEAILLTAAPLCHPGWDIGLLLSVYMELSLTWWDIRQVVDIFLQDHDGGRCQTTGPSACSVSCVREVWRALQRKFSPADALCWKPWRSLPRMERWGRGHQRRSIGGDASYFDIPTMPFMAVNFHFRGRSMRVTATLVLLSRHAWWLICLLKRHSSVLRFLFWFLLLRREDMSNKNFSGHIMMMPSHPHPPNWQIGTRRALERRSNETEYCVMQHQ